MKKTGLALGCVLLLAGCPVPQTPSHDFTGRWTGTLTGNYNCMDGTTIQVVFQQGELDISQSGTSDSILVSFCNGLVLDGTASGNELDVAASADTSLSCTLVDQSNSNVTINQFSGGSFTFDNAKLDAKLDENISLTDSSGNATSCSGTAIGALSM
jgi:hypothetical protein